MVLVRNLCSLNFCNTHFIKFLTKNGCSNEINIEYKNKLISNSPNLKFLGIIIDNTLSWKNHIDMIAPKLCQACYTVRRTKPYLSRNAHKMTMLFFTQLCLMGLFSGKFHT